VEFDTLYLSGYDDYYKNDPNTPHVAVVSNKAGTDTISSGGYWTGSWWDRQWVPSTSVTLPYSYAFNKHNSSNNDNCSSTSGSGCYKSSGTFANGTTMSVRMEAYSGCNSGGTACNGNGSNNYICVYAWKTNTASTDATTLGNMQNVTKFFKFPGETNDLGNPIVKDCFQNTATTNYDLDSVRYGFTIATGNYDFDLTLTNFKHYITNYQ